jgi:hypothetical protein
VGREFLKKQLQTAIQPLRPKVLKVETLQKIKYGGRRAQLRFIPNSLKIGSGTS